MSNNARIRKARRDFDAGYRSGSEGRRAEMCRGIGASPAYQKGLQLGLRDWAMEQVRKEKDRKARLERENLPYVELPTPLSKVA